MVQTSAMGAASEPDGAYAGTGAAGLANESDEAISLAFDWLVSASASAFLGGDPGSFQVAVAFGGGGFEFYDAFSQETPFFEEISFFSDPECGCGDGSDVLSGSGSLILAPAQVVVLDLYSESYGLAAIQAVPAPAALPLALLGLGALAALRRQRPMAR